MITTGWEPTNGFSVSTHKGKRSEILDLSMSESYICYDWVDYPISLEGATAGVLGTNVVLCGGGRCSSANCQHQGTEGQRMADSAMEQMEPELFRCF